MPAALPRNLRPLRAQGNRIPWLWVPAAFTLVAALVAAKHTTFTEFDGLMQLFAGQELLETGRYRGWPSHFWPPLYPSLIALLEPVFGGFWAGKIISIASAGLILNVVHRLARRAGAGPAAAIVAQTLVAVNPLFFLNAIQAQNHMLDAALLSLAVLGIASATNGRGWMLAGVATGAAVMTRYTSVVLLPAGALIAITTTKHDRFKRAALFVTPALLVAFPWLYQNWKLNGSPVATWQHLNIGSAFLDPDDSLARWWWLLQSKYHNIADVLRADPGGYLANAGRNTLEAAGHLFVSAGAAIVALPFAALVRGRAARTVALVLGLFFLLVVQAFLRDYLFLPSAILLTTLGVAGASRLKRFAAPLAAALMVAGVVLSVVRTGEFLDRFNAGATPGASAAAAAIRDDAGPSSRPAVMAVHPIYAYECACDFLMSPLYYKGSLEGFVQYGGLSYEVRRYAPRSPHDLADGAAQYLVFNRGLRNFLPQYEFLLDPASSRVPAGWRAIYTARDVVVYRLRS